MSDKPLSIGVFLCDCGGKISQTIDFEKLVGSISDLKCVKFVKRHSFLCGDEGENLIKSHVKNVDRIVIAACSPKLYEHLFRNLLSGEGFNPFLLEIANLREQCAWPHSDDYQGAYEKASRIVFSAIERVRRTFEIERKGFDINKNVLVVGGGVAGLEAAVDIASFGFNVTVIEREAIVGGNALQIGLSFPSDDGAFCISSPNFLSGIRKCYYRSGLLQHPNLKIRTLSEVVGFDGSFGNFNVKICSKPRGVVEKLCINCGICSELCPIEVFGGDLPKRKAIYLPHANAVPPVYLVDWDNCNRCGKCVEACPTKAINLDDKIHEDAFAVGAIVIATGFQEFDPTNIHQYKYGVSKNVITQLELAKMLDPFGSKEGILVRPTDGASPKNVVIVQCVGSRDRDINPYCSRVCCTIALKHAIEIKERYRESEVFICYMDIRPVGKEYERYYLKAMELGTTFIRGRPSEIIENPETSNLIVRTEDTVLGEQIELEADLVVLSTGMIPSDGSCELVDMLGVEVGREGFVKELYPKLRPIETNVKGIYVCGGAHSPKDIPESVTQAEATAFKVVSDLSIDKYEKDMIIATINEEYCDGCELCVDICPYDALKMIPRENSSLLLAIVDEMKCEGCGLCSSKCPTGAVQLIHSTDNQVLNQLRVLLSKEYGSISPKVVALCCDECGYATVDLVGMAMKKYPCNIFSVRIPCLGWISLYRIFKTFEYGADALLLVGCEEGNCQHLKGDIYARRIVSFAKDILDEIGLDRRRLEVVSLCAYNIEKFLSASIQLLEEIKKLDRLYE
ncbi:MAG: hydrogenase iron-sulfur subunit [Promethearchaeota archaeon]|jgi:heterodisulfide reductase subunit A